MASQLLVGLVKLAFQLNHTGVSSILTGSVQELLIRGFQLLGLGLRMVSGSFGLLQFRIQISYVLVLDCGSFQRVSGGLTCCFQIPASCFEVSLQVILAPLELIV